MFPLMANSKTHLGRSPLFLLKFHLVLKRWWPEEGDKLL